MKNTIKINYISFNVAILPYEYNGVLVEDGIIEQAIKFVEANTKKLRFNYR